MAMQTEAQLTNPLGLDITFYGSGITPPHEVTDEAKRVELTASMDANGWTGAPIIADAETQQGYSGSHRIEAWAHSDRHWQPIPVIWIDDLAAHHGISWDDLLDEYDGDGIEAATALAYALPSSATDAYGLDLH